MSEAVTPPNPAAGNGRPHIPDPTLLTIDSIRREIAMLDGQLDIRLQAAEALIVERLRRIDQLMDQAEEMRKEQKADTKAAVDAALESQKEATAKMEKSIYDQVSSLGAMFETEVRSLRAIAADNKQAIVEQRALRAGLHDQKTEQRAVTQGQLALVGAVITVGMIVVQVILFLLRSGAG